MAERSAIAPSDACWWQRGVVYQIYPRSFQDSDGDGTGDLTGVIRRLDYLVGLGIDAVWLSPFFRSPMKDFGYDVSDYRDVDPIFGTLADAERLIVEAHDRDLRVIVDYVPNHTSDQHPWFVESRSSRDNPKRDWYIWRDPAPDGGVPNNWISTFGGSAWAWDDATGQYYLHSYLTEQPDLNWRNPDVQEAMLAVLRFWMDRGIDGFRVDVLWKLAKDAEFRDNPPNPHHESGVLWSFEHEPVYSESRPEVHDLVRMMRREVDAYDDTVLIGELYFDFPELVPYYGERLDGCHLPFNLALVINPWRAGTVADLILRYEAALPEGAWPNWVLGNHDQSRLATRIGDAQAWVAAMLLLTLRGTPTIYCGEEIGMRDGQIAREDEVDPAGRMVEGMNRDPERTPMQWAPGPGAGFTTGQPWLPIAADADRRNVAVQTADPGSMLSLYRDLLSLRRQEPAMAVGGYERVWSEGDVLAYIRTDGKTRFLVALNFGGEAASLPEVGEGTVVLGTDRSREGAQVAGHLTLAPNEGAIVRISGDDAARVSPTNR
jgi:alpha-glucosidase